MQKFLSHGQKPTSCKTGNQMLSYFKNLTIFIGQSTTFASNVLIPSSKPCIKKFFFNATRQYKERGMEKGGSTTQWLDYTAILLHLTCFPSLQGLDANPGWPCGTPFPLCSI